MRPTALELRFTADGYGSLIVEVTKNIDIVIDMTQMLLIFHHQRINFLMSTCYHSDVEITSEQLVITDVDIPVEIKADAPIQVEIDNSDNWLNIREIT